MVTVGIGKPNTDYGFKVVKGEKIYHNTLDIKFIMDYMRKMPFYDFPM